MATSQTVQTSEYIQHLFSLMLNSFKYRLPMQTCPSVLESNSAVTFWPLSSFRALLPRTLFEYLYFHQSQPFKVWLMFYYHKGRCSFTIYIKCKVCTYVHFMCSERYVLIQRFPAPVSTASLLKYMSLMTSVSWCKCEIPFCLWFLFRLCVLPWSRPVYRNTSLHKWQIY